MQLLRKKDRKYAGQQIKQICDGGQCVYCSLILMLFSIAHTMLCKQAIRGIGANKTKESITRIGKAIGPLAEVTSNFDRDVLTSSNNGQHKVASAKKDNNIVINELLNHAHVFEETKDRHHHCFKDFCKKGSLFMKVSKKHITKWIQDNVHVHGAC